MSNDLWLSLRQMAHMAHGGYPANDYTMIQPNRKFPPAPPNDNTQTISPAEWKRMQSLPDEPPAPLPEGEATRRINAMNPDVLPTWTPGSQNVNQPTLDPEIWEKVPLRRWPDHALNYFYGPVTNKATKLHKALSRLEELQKGSQPSSYEEAMWMQRPDYWADKMGREFDATWDTNTAIENELIRRGLPWAGSPEPEPKFPLFPPGHPFGPQRPPETPRQSAPEEGYIPPQLKPANENEPQE